MADKRDGKPTAFQIGKLKDFGYDIKSVKTYRDAENALKRIKRAKSATSFKESHSDKIVKNGRWNSNAAPAKDKAKAKSGSVRDLIAVPLPRGCAVVGLIIAVDKKAVRK